MKLQMAFDAATSSLWVTHENKKTQLNISGTIIYGNISFLLSQTQLAKNSSELKLTCFFFQNAFSIIFYQKTQTLF